ncbi:MAG: aldehyde dehydrogenase [Sphingobium sp.]
MATVDLPQSAVSKDAARHHHGLLLIDGEWCEAASGERFDVLNPSTEAVIGSAAAAGQADVDRAVAVARRAMEQRIWADIAPSQRARIMFRIADLIDGNVEELAMAETRENGMPLLFARYSMTLSAEMFRYYGGWITKIHGQTSDLSCGNDYHAYTLREPVGVAALIIPWNGPIMMAAQKLAPALAAGCASILKPAENTPLNVLGMVKIMLEAGVPSGMIQVLTGFGNVTGAALAAHDGVDKVAFTGSTATGREIVRLATGNLKRVSLELGGKSPVIVLDDAQIEQTVAGILNGVMLNSGQACIAGSRLYVQRGIHDRLMQALGDAADKMVVGDGFDPSSQIGPVISRAQMDKILGYVDTGVSDGAELVTGGRRVGDTGYFVKPTILTGAPQNSRLVKEEVFGPVLAATVFDTVDEAVALANDTQYGLSGGIYTRDVGNVHKIARRIRGGYLFVNCYSVVDPSMPFGGFKQSGWGRELGKEGLDAYLDTKSVFVAL